MPTYIKQNRMLLKYLLQKKIGQKKNNNNNILNLIKENFKTNKRINAIVLELFF